MTKLDLSSNYFDLFGLAIRFEIDEPQLAKQFRHLQQQLHPDRFVARPDAERRWSMQIKVSVVEQKDAFSKAMVSQDYASARVTTRQWQFLDKLLKEAKRIEERLDV